MERLRAITESLPAQVTRLHAGQLQRYVQRSGTIHHGYGMARASVGSEISLETVDIAADRRDESRIQAVLEISPLVTRKTGLVQGDVTLAYYAADGIDDLIDHGRCACSAHRL